MSTRIALTIVMLIVAASAPTIAQSTGHGVVSGFAGWVFSDGVDGNAVVAGDGNVYDRVDPKDAFSYGFTVTVMATDHVGVGFMYTNQPSKFVLGGTNEREVADWNIKTYHGIVEYNFGEPEMAVRPFLFGGFGATNYGSFDATIAGINRSVGGETQFSSTWGGGVKAYPGKVVGVLAQFRYTPTYIKTDPGGWWCDPFYGCYGVGNPQYANQFEFSGGVTFRF
jgi:outer membrane protein W